MSRTLPPWNIYAKTMFHLHEGYPIWAPEPESKDQLLEIGSVIFQTPLGNYRQLFNASKEANDPVNKDGAPDGHEVFQPTQSIVSGPRTSIQQNVYHSNHIRSRSTKVEASG